MLERLKYKNHRNETFDFGIDGIYVNANDLRDYKWTVTERNNRFASFDRAPASKTLPVVIMCDTAEKGIAARNKLFEVVEKDVLAAKHGQIIIGDYYYRCFVTENKKSKYMQTERKMVVDLTVVSDFPYWVKESTYTLENSSGSAAAIGEDYALFDYPHDFAGTNQLTSLVNANFVASNFRLIIHGAVTNPTVYIGGHKYNVNCTVGEGEYLTIDTVAKTVVLTRQNGETVNQFKNRSRESYLFEKIPSGKVDVSWDGTLAMTIILLEERSEPKWT